MARGVVEGGTIDSIAAALGVSRETLRTQVKSVRAKTGAARQADLVGLLMGISSLLG